MLTLCVLTWALNPTLRVLMVYFIRSQCRRMIARSSTAAGLGTLAMSLRTQNRATSALDGRLTAAIVKVCTVD